MDRPFVLITKQLPEEVEHYIGKYCDYEIHPDGFGTKEELYDHLRPAQGFLQVGETIDKELLDHTPYLKVVSNISAGYENFDLEAMKAQNVIGTNTPEVVDDSVADLVIGLMLAVSRRIPELDRYIRHHEWVEQDPRHLFGKDMHHKTVGIIGMGHVGEAVAKRAKFGFDMKVVYHNRHHKAAAEHQLGVVYNSMDELLATSDFVVITTPLTEETRGLIDEEAFKKMKSDAILINASRGAIVDEKALVQALETHDIAGAGLDVYEQEPLPFHHELLKMDQTVLLPHIGSATQETREKMCMRAAHNLVAALRGKEVRDKIG